MEPAAVSGKYRNVFLELGHDEREIADRMEAIFQTCFYDEEERFYHETGDDMGYMEDTGNHDARTEGMSYGMMVCVQLNKKAEFDRLWKWARTFMYLSEGANAGYFAWSCRTDGKKNSYGAAPDGEEFFIMALFFASARWGDGEGIYNYSKEANAILNTCLHKPEGKGTGPMWNPENKLIRFIAGADFTDPSYHLPHFYELYAHFTEGEEKAFFQEAAVFSREYLKKACHPITGLCAEYAEYDGSPKLLSKEGEKQFGSRHDWYYSDAYRTIANIGLDYSWFGKTEWECEIADKHQKFFCETVKEHSDGIYLIDGTVLDGKALHPIAMIATNAQASLAARGKYASECVERFWNTPLRTGDRRYYDNFLYLFAFMALSGNYRIWR